MPQSNRPHLEKLNQILLSENVIEDFNENYHGNFANWLDQAVPEVNLCINQTQKTPWHLYNVWDHSLYAIAYLNMMTENLSEDQRLTLAYTMFFHDLGKPACHSSRVVKGQVVDSFKNHQAVSSQIFQRVSQDWHFKPQTSTAINWLITKHDIFADPQVTNANNLTALAQSIPENLDQKTMMHYLGLVGRADNLAQNRAMSCDTLKRINQYFECIDMREAIDEMEK